MVRDDQLLTGEQSRFLAAHIGTGPVEVEEMFIAFATRLEALYGNYTSDEVVLLIARWIDRTNAGETLSDDQWLNLNFPL